jgi:hypothetical protein
LPITQDLAKINIAHETRSGSKYSIQGGVLLLKFIGVLSSIILPGSGHLFLAFYPHFNWSLRHRNSFKRGMYFLCVVLFLTLLTHYILVVIVIFFLWLWAIIDVFRLAEHINRHASAQRYVR